MGSSGCVEVLPALVDAKGDLIVATADNVVARLPVGTNNQVLTADSAQASGLRWGPVHDDVVKIGQFVPPRMSTVTTNTVLNGGTGAMVLAGFTADKTASIVGIKMWTGNTAAAATPTLCRIGVYVVNADESLTLVASTANDTTLFSATYTEYQRNFTSAFSMIAGVRYACAVLIVTAAAMPTFQGFSGGAASTISFALGVKPFAVASNAGQTNLPATVAAVAIGAERNTPLFYLS